MDTLTQIITALNALSPLGLAGLLGFIIYKLIQGNRQLKSVQDNHLHELPEIAETLRRVEAAQTAAFVKMITLLENR